jgi:hypothetical protein
MLSLKGAARGGVSPQYPIDPTPTPEEANPPARLHAALRHTRLVDPTLNLEETRGLQPRQFQSSLALRSLRSLRTSTPYCTERPQGAEYSGRGPCLPSAILVPGPGPRAPGRGQPGTARHCCTMGLSRGFREHYMGSRIGGDTLGLVDQFVGTD